MDSDSSTHKIERLTSSNYHTWKQRIIHLLALKDLDEFVDEEQPANLDGDGGRSWLRKDRKAQAIIGLSISNELLENVRNCTSAKQMWSSIKDVFERHTLLNKLAARRQFYTAVKSESETILQFSNRIRQLADTLKSMSVLIDDSELAMALLNGLPEQYDALISALDAVGNDDHTLSFDHVKARVMQEEQRMGMRHAAATVQSEAAALLSQQTNANRQRPQCTYCKKVGHVEDKCWKKYPHLNPHKKQNPDQAAIAISENIANDSDVICLLASHIKSTKLDHWFLDSGCSNHLTHDKSNFQSYSDIAHGSRTSVEVGNGDKALVMGKGTVHLSILVNSASKACELYNVLYAPDLDYNLVSISSLDKKGFTTTFSNARCRIEHDGRILATGSMFNNLYKLDMDPCHTVNPSALVTHTLDLWHQRLAHVDHNSIKTMASTGAVKGVHLKTPRPLHTRLCTLHRRERSSVANSIRVHITYVHRPRVVAFRLVWTTRRTIPWRFEILHDNH